MVKSRRCTSSCAAPVTLLMSTNNQSTALKLLLLCSLISDHASAALPQAAASTHPSSETWLKDLYQRCLEFYYPGILLPTLWYRGIYWAEIVGSIPTPDGFFVRELGWNLMLGLWVKGCLCYKLARGRRISCCEGCPQHPSCTPRRFDTVLGRTRSPLSHWKRLRDLIVSCNLFLPYCRQHPFQQLDRHE